MDATLNPQNQEQPLPMEMQAEKSELMQVFENHVKDAYWAYKDLLRAIFEQEEGMA